LDYSQKKCSKFSDFDHLTPEELESFEAFCARFARTSAILIQKVFTTIFLLLKEPQQSVIDKIHRAEKLGITESAETLLEIRDIRNEISHEYADTSLIQIFQDVLRLAPALKKASKKGMAFTKPLTKPLKQ
jgi:hypothetical protein